MGGTGSEELTPLACSVTRARCSALFTDATLVSSSSATSFAFQRRTSHRISTARWRGGRCWSAATNASRMVSRATATSAGSPSRSEEHTSELQSQSNLVCRLLLEKTKVFLDLREAGDTCSNHRVARLIREHQLRALHGYRMRRWSVGKPSVLIPNLLHRQFTVTRT